jgi:hypothetical protein
MKPILRTIRAVASAPRRHKADGFEVAFLRPELIQGGMDPFIQIDAFSLAQPVFKPHPHAGFNAVTYIFPESPIGFINRDSLGTRNRISPGSIHWTAAGRGVQHEEIPEVRGIAVLGLQTFINLPREKKHMAPGFFHLDAENVPMIDKTGCVIRVVTGRSNGAVSPLETPTPDVRIIDVTMRPGGVFEQELDANDNAFLWIFDGSAVAEGANGARTLDTFDLLGYERDGTHIRVLSGSQGARLALLAGPPLNEPIVAGGPFVMSTEAELAEAFENFRSGRMGTLTTSSYDADGRPVEAW